MTLDEFRTLIELRIPTPQEFVSFAEGQGWQFVVNGEKAGLLADKNDPMALKFAKMLSREPYRTNVLKFLAERTEPEPQPVAVEVVAAPAPTPESERCKLCNRDVSNAEDRERLNDPLFCANFGNDEMRDRSGNITLASTPRCPYKRSRKDQWS